MASQLACVCPVNTSKLSDFTVNSMDFRHEKQSQSTEVIDRCVPLVDFVLGRVDDLLDTLAVHNDSTVQNCHENDVSTRASSQTEGETSPGVNLSKAVTCSIGVQTSEDLISDAVSDMKSKLFKSHCELEVLKEHFKGVEERFSDEIGQHFSAAQKAQRDLEKSQQEMADLRKRLASLEKESALESGDHAPAVDEYKPESTQGYRPVIRPKFNKIREHYFEGETLPPAWARRKPPSEPCSLRDQPGIPLQQQVNRAPTHFLPPPPPPPSLRYYRPDHTHMVPPHRRYEHYGDGLPLPPSPPFCRPLAGSIPPPVHSMNPQRGRPNVPHDMVSFNKCELLPLNYEVTQVTAEAPPPHEEIAPRRTQARLDVSQRSCSDKLSSQSAPRPGDFVVRPMSPCQQEIRSTKVRFGVTEILYI